MTSNATMKPAELNELIRRIYSTSLDPSTWTHVLAQLEEVSGEDALPRSAQNAALGRLDVSGMDDPALRRGRHRGGRLRSRNSLSEDMPDFRQLLDQHLRLAMQISEKMSVISHQQHLLQQAFDRLADAMFFLGRNRRVLIANRAAYALIEDDDGLSLVNGTLTAALRPTADRLRSLISSIDASQTGPSRQFDALPIPKRSGGRPLHLLAMAAVSGMEDHLTPFLAGRPSVFLVVSDPDRQAALPEDRLSAIFGLTPAEARLAAALAGGLSVNDYAEKVGITENTARWTLKQVQTKTDCRRQLDLARLLRATTSVC